MKDQGLGSWTRRRARMTPDRAALVQDGRMTTYADLHRDSTRLAHGLRARGIERGDRVAFLGLNSVELVLAMFATAKLGAVFVPVNTRLAPPELAYVLEHSGSRLLLVEDALADGVADVWPRARPERFTFQRASRPRSRRAPRSPGRRSDGPDPEIDEPIALDDLFMIQYTSGTSGRPKGVMLTHANVVWNVYNLLVDIDLTSERGRPRHRAALPHRRAQPGALPHGAQGRYRADRGEVRSRRAPST